MYLLNFANRKLMNEIFDKLHAQKRMKYINQFISHDYLIFAIWRIVFDFNNSKRKKRVIVNIRDFNKIIFINSYFMSLQSNIIVAVTKCRYIFVFDVVDFFHQWLVKFADRHKLTIVSHREQKQFNVTIMNFKNFSSYVQRKIDAILRNLRDFIRVYVDDIVVFFNTFEKHMTHLHSMFQRLNFYDISLSFKKFFLSYFTIALLKQKIDVFDFITTTDKLETIVKLNFSYTLKTLKIYLNFTKWLREFVTFYAQKTNALQRRKTFLLRQFSFNKKTIRKIYLKKTMINNFSIEKLKSYRFLQKTFNKTSFLMHFNSNRQFYINIDVFKRREFETIIYHFKINVIFDKFKRNDIEFILFLNRMLNEIEIKYWFIELKMCDFVWIVRRIQHMIETIKNIIVIFTNYAINISIVKQITMNSKTRTNSIGVLFAFKFTCRNLDSKWNTNRKNNHIVFDALWWLISENEQIKRNFESIFNFDNYHKNIIDFFDDSNCYVFQNILIVMSKKFKKEIKNDY